MIREMERLVYLLQQTYTSFDTQTIKQAQRELEEACQDIRLPKMIYEILKNSQFDNQLKFSSANLIHKKWIQCNSQEMKNNIVRTNSAISSLNNIIEDSSIYGELKIPVIKASFELQLRQSLRSISIYTKLAASVGYYCRVKRTVLAMVMLHEILKFNRRDKKLLEILSKEEELKMTVIYKKQIFKKCLGDTITSVYFHLKQMIQGKGDTIGLDCYSSSEQFYRGWQSVSLMLCQFSFDKYHESVPDIFEPKSINSLLTIIITHPLFQNQQSREVRNNAFRVMTHLFTGYTKAKLYNKFPQFAETVKQISQDQYKHIIEKKQSSELVDSVTDLFLAIIKQSNFIFENRPLLQIQYFSNYYFLPIYQSFYIELSGAMKEQDHEEISRLISFTRYPQYHRKNNRNIFQLKCLMEHSQFYNIACILGTILQKIPDTEVIIYQYLLSLIDNSIEEFFGFPNKQTRCNVGLLIIILLAENLNKYSEFISKIFRFIFSSHIQISQTFTNSQVSNSQNSIISLFLYLNLYSTYADQISVIMHQSEHQLPQSFLHLITNTGYSLITIISLNCLEVYLQQNYSGKEEEKRLKIIVNQLLLLLQNCQKQNRQNNKVIKTASIIFFNALEIHSEIFDENQFEQIFRKAFELIDLVDSTRALQLCNKILKNKSRGYQQITHTLFHKLIPFLLGFTHDKESSEDLTNLCCDLILSLIKDMESSNSPQIHNLNAQVQSALVHIIMDMHFPDNHAENYILFLYRLFWRLRDTQIGQNDQFLMPLFLHKCLLYLNTIDMPAFMVQKYLGDSVYSATRFFLMANWIIINHPNQINQNHVNMTLDILDKLIKFKNKHDLIFKEKDSRSFIYGKMKVLTLLMILKAPQLTFHIMSERNWLQPKNIYCENYQQAAIFFICSSTYHYQLEYDIPFIATQLTEKMKALLTPNYQNDLGLVKYAHLYLKLCIQCIQKVHFRDNYSDRKFQSKIQRSELKNLSRDGYYENDVSQSSEEECEQGIKMMSYYLCQQELSRIIEQMNVLPREKYHRFINQFFRSLSNLKKDRRNWVDKIFEEYISEKTSQNIKNMINVKNWNENFLKPIPRKRIYLKVKNSG